MAPDLPFDIPSVHWQAWVIPLAGLASAGLTLVMGRALFRKRRQCGPTAEKLAGEDPFVRGSASERRSALRRSGKYVKVFVSDENNQGQPEQGCVLDRSLGGICFTLSHCVEPDCVLSVRSIEASSDSPWVKVQVKRCEKRKEGEWEVGCQFVRTPSWSSLLQFG